MKVGDIIYLRPYKSKIEISIAWCGIVLDIVWDDKIVTGEPIKFYKVLWANGIIGSISDYFVKSTSRLEILDGTRLDSKMG